MLQNRKYNALSLGIAVLLILLPWIFFDVDIGDQSFSNVSSWVMAFHPARPAEYHNFSGFAPFWFSLMVDSFWWRIIGPEAPLVFVRLGWLLWNAGVAAGVFLLLGNLFDKRRVFWAVLFTAQVVNCAADHFVLTYNSVAPALGALAFGLLTVSLQETNMRRAGMWAAISGFVAVFVVGARIPSLPFVALFFTGVLLAELVKTRRLPVARAFWIAGGALMGLVIFCMMLKAGQQWDIYSEGLLTFFRSASQGSDARYTKTAVLLKAVGHYQKIVVGAAFFATGAWMVSRWRAALFPCLGVFFFVALAKYGVALAFLIGAPIALITLRSAREWRDLPLWHWGLGWGALLVLVAFTFGTYLEGLQSYKYGVWLLFPVGFLQLEKISLSWLSAKRIQGLLAGAAIIIFLVTRVQWPTFPYLERTIFSMSRPFGQPTLKWIRTYREKQAGLDELASALENLGLRPGQTLLAYSGTPPLYPVSFVYSMTRTVPLFLNPAIVEYPTNRWPSNKQQLLIMAKEDTLPRLVVRLKAYFPFFLPSVKTLLTDVWHQIPPAVAAEPFHWPSGVDRGLSGEMDEILQTAGYRPAWENNYFVVLKK